MAQAEVVAAAGYRIQTAQPPNWMRHEITQLNTTIESQAFYISQLEHQRRELLLQNATDPLTNLGNRRAFQQRLDSELSLPASAGSSVALVIVDVDSFKHYNDSFGHPAGDMILQLLADVIRRSCREQDFPARVGGEEFAIILPGTSRAGSHLIAERLCQRMGREVWPHRPVTISVGVALTTAGLDDGTRLAERADAALYRSKGDGRNRVTMADCLQ